MIPEEEKQEHILMLNAIDFVSLAAMRKKYTEEGNKKLLELTNRLFELKKEHYPEQFKVYQQKFN